MSGRRNLTAWCGLTCVSGMRTLAGACWTVPRRQAGVGPITRAVETPRLESSHEGEVYEYKSLSEGDVVDLEWEAPGQDGFGYRATVVRKR